MGERGHHECAGQAWGDQVGANPVDRGKPGSKLHLVCDGSGLPLTAAVAAANVNDTAAFQAVMDDVPPIRTPLSWLSCFRRLQVRWDRDSGRWFAFVLMAGALVCFQRLPLSCLPATSCRGAEPSPVIRLGRGRR